MSYSNEAIKGPTSESSPHCEIVMVDGTYKAEEKMETSLFERLQDTFFQQLNPHRGTIRVREGVFTHKESRISDITKGIYLILEKEKTTKYYVIDVEEKGQVEGLNSKKTYIVAVDGSSISHQGKDLRINNDTSGNIGPTLYLDVSEIKYSDGKNPGEQSLQFKYRGSVKTDKGNLLVPTKTLFKF